MSNDNIMALEEWEQKEREELKSSKPLNSSFVLLDRGPYEWDSELWEQMLKEEPF